ncbi:hypothetical protein GPECTOR_29g130 [Gonium pectorale]|uniref:Adhesin domain-containing protein n=1 Tax=Gonium pectorale TaxID=33097 RepID=A0A150GEG7_GONPE|nr:hypothetical protein GPECTOR_29g130 [Gonium pectorale]|eukprot:KXZ48226.1 hypothetical protein GPECTOR_29g130 [Gonium pectorale]
MVACKRFVVTGGRLFLVALAAALAASCVLQPAGAARHLQSNDDNKKDDKKADDGGLKRVPITGSASGETGGSGGGGGGATVNVKAPGTIVSTSGPGATTVVAPGAAVATKDGTTVVRAPTTIVANTPDQVAVRNTFTNVDVDKKSGSGSVDVPVIGRICWGNGCGKRHLLQAAASGSEGKGGGDQATVQVVAPGTDVKITKGDSGPTTVSITAPGANVTRQGPTTVVTAPGVNVTKQTSGSAGVINITAPGVSVSGEGGNITITAPGVTISRQADDGRLSVRAPFLAIDTKPLEAAARNNASSANAGKESGSACLRIPIIGGGVAELDGHCGKPAEGKAGGKSEGK